MKQNLKLGTEYPEVDEEINTRKMADLLIEKKEKKYPAGKVLRGFHSKMHGCVKAEFTVDHGLSEELRVGIFSKEQTFPAWVRFSNGADTVQPDAKKGFRGFAIKLMDVPGEKLLEEGDNETSQDFLFFSKDFISPGNVKDTWEGMHAFFNGPLKLLVFFLNPRHWGILKDFITMPEHCANLLEIPYYSATPYRFGTTGAVKYVIVPRKKKESTMPNKPTDDFLKERLISDLDSGDFYFDFMIQHQTDPIKMPIENAAKSWKAPYVKLASIKIPKQSFDTAEQYEFGENLSYNVWHSLPEHRPLGGVNRARKTVYQLLSDFRLKRNGAVKQEPQA